METDEPLEDARPSDRPMDRPPSGVGSTRGAASGATPTDEPPLPTTPRKREAEEWALVLQAEGVPVRVVRREATWSVDVPPGEFERAAASLAAWRLERATPPPPPDPTAIFRTPSPAETLLAVACASTLVAFHLGLERAGRLAAFIDRGANQAALVLAGELHRCMAALTLHADLGHAAGNALFGAFFLAMLTARIGLGLAVACFVATGAVGNLADALYYRAAHSTIGASTGVFGLVGVLTGLAAWRRHRRGVRRRGAWVALGAGLALVAMLGGAGPEVALAAHLFGLVVGALAGLALALPLARRPRPGRAVQLVAFASSLGAIALAWMRAGP
ncbi:MAG: rhomboid family intramembrane serine protease [Myxococcota bacterium]